MNAKANPAADIVLLGLGPGTAASLTREAWTWLEQIDTLFLRTNHHPTVAGLPTHLTLHSFDDLYNSLDSFEDVYDRIVEKILSLAEAKSGVTYAVPGHPFIAEATSPEIAKRAKATGLSVRVIDGLSFLSPTLTLLGVDPLPEMTLADAITLSMAQTPGFPPSYPALVAQIYSKAIASDVKLTLMTVYPDEHPVQLVHGAGTSDAVLEELPLYAMDHSPHLGLLSSLYIPPLAPTSSFESFQEIVARLRAPDGCPWDRKQTHESLRPFLLEETYETLDALDRGDQVDLVEELGDLMLQVFLHAQIASEEGAFNIHDVLDGIGQKLIRRHPHVFSDVQVEGVSGVVQHWEAIKAEERQENGTSRKKGLLDGVPMALPALSQAQAILERVDRVGFLGLKREAEPDALRARLERLLLTGHSPADFAGVLMGLAALAWSEEVDLESSLRKALSEFKLRFTRMERLADESGQTLSGLSSETLQALWLSASDSMAKDNEGNIQDD